MQTDSLNNRFAPRREVACEAVFVCDDDVEVRSSIQGQRCASAAQYDETELNAAFDVWRAHRQQLVGFFPRAHAVVGDTNACLPNVMSAQDAAGAHTYVLVPQQSFVAMSSSTTAHSRTATRSC